MPRTPKKTVPYTLERTTLDGRPVVLIRDAQTPDYITVDISPAIAAFPTLHAPQQDGEEFTCRVDMVAVYGGLNLSAQHLRTLKAGIHDVRGDEGLLNGANICLPRQPDIQQAAKTR